VNCTCQRWLRKGVEENAVDDKEAGNPRLDPTWGHTWASPQIAVIKTCRSGEIKVGMIVLVCFWTRKHVGQCSSGRNDHLFQC